jgi:hypothetical protein
MLTGCSPRISQRSYCSIHSPSVVGRRATSARYWVTVTEGSNPVLAGTLDDPAAFKPTMDLYWSSAQPWFNPVASGRDFLRCRPEPEPTATALADHPRLYLVEATLRCSLNCMKSRHRAIFALTHWHGENPLLLPSVIYVTWQGNVLRSSSRSPLVSSQCWVIYEGWAAWFFRIKRCFASSAMLKNAGI